MSSFFWKGHAAKLAAFTAYIKLDLVAGFHSTFHVMSPLHSQSMLWKRVEKWWRVAKPGA